MHCRKLLFRDIVYIVQKYSWITALESGNEFAVAIARQIYHNKHVRQLRRWVLLPAITGGRGKDEFRHGIVNSVHGHAVCAPMKVRPLECRDCIHVRSR
jgi:hypothetical protein